VDEVRSLAATHGLRAGAINPNVFQDQIYKHGSLGNPDAATRQAALDHCWTASKSASA
jgi:L-rhamnose isomerase / sugar isomerase